MTGFAGIFLRKGNSGIPDKIRTEIRSLLSRHPSENILEQLRPNFYLAHFDIGSFGHSGLHSEVSDSLIAIAGDPIIESANQSQDRNRYQELLSIYRSLKSSEGEILSNTRGVFCGVYYDPSKSQLILFSDRLGIRPVYYTAVGEQFIFATALRVLEGLPSLVRSLDLRGATESVAFGFPLGNRTPYEGIFTIGPAQLICIDQNSTKCNTYFHWDHIQRSSVGTAKLADLAYETFLEAVSLRLSGREAAFALLSGGMDSRCIVSALRSLNVTVATFNISPKNTLDEYLAAEFARVVGTTHYRKSIQVTSFESAGGLSDLVAKAIKEAQVGFPTASVPEVWGGDGGSVGLGHEYLTEEMVDAVITGDCDYAVHCYRRKNNIGLPLRLFRKDITRKMETLLDASILEELKGVDPRSVDRALYLFLLFNDQRRHLAKHFENIDLNRVEYCLPFLDANFLAVVMRVPIKECLYHRFYTAFFERFPEVTRKVPWQTYPGHIPCPLAAPSHLGYQWSQTESMLDIVQWKKIALRVLFLIMRGKVPSEIVRRDITFFASIAELMGIRRTVHILKAAARYSDYFTRTGGTIKPF